MRVPPGWDGKAPNRRGTQDAVNNVRKHRSDKDSRRPAPSFRGLRPSSERASSAARGASAKANTRCEKVLRRELWRRGVRYRLHLTGMPGRPDIVFPRQRIAIFCDGDFWHGRGLKARLAKLRLGHNAEYWSAKLLRNVQRDREVDAQLHAAGWIVVRLWETDILTAPADAADRVAAALTSVSSGPALAPP